MARLSVLAASLLLALPTLVAGLNYVHTPHGKMRSDCVHHIPSGHLLKENSATTELDLFSPSGVYVRTIPKCLNQDQHPLFEPNTRRSKHIVLQESSLSKHAAAAAAASKQDPPVFPPDYDGWLAYTAWNTSGGIDTFLGNFSVPDSPASMPDILYLFTGLQNIDWIPKVDPNPDGFDIIQPVLQYPADEGAGWSIKSWYVTLDDGALYSDEIQVNAGDNIFGNMTQTGNSSWYIGSTASSTQQTTVLNVDRPRLAGQYWAYNTLECYGCVDCTTFPLKPCEFSELVLLKDGLELEPEWRLNPKPAAQHFCHETITQITPVAQNIDFQAQY